MLRTPSIAVLIALLAAAPAAAEIARIKQRSGAAVVQRGEQKLKPAPGLQLLAGDSLIGAKLGIRSGLSVSVGEESDDRTRNRVTILSECRVAPLVLVPAAFASFTTTVTP